MADATVMKIALAGLLHDVGKFAQRANLEKVFPEIIENYDEFCPVKDGHHGYLHAAHTAFFIEQYIPERLFDKTELYNGARHHKNSRGDIYKEADMLSAGMDRSVYEHDEGKSYKEARLHSIFDLIELQYMIRDKKGQFKSKWTLPLAPMGENPGKEIFPYLDETISRDLSEISYEKLWQQFVEEVEQIEGSSPAAWFHEIYWLLEKYTSRIPSATNVFPDISLFDHSRTTAALASLLHLAGNSAKGKFLLYGGDITGIKNYIYKISQGQGTGGIAKRLRGRSFTVSMLAEVFARYVCRLFGLTIANINFCGGGNLEILLPDTPEARNLLAEFEKDANTWLIETFQGELGYVGACVDLSADDLRNDRYAHRREELGDALGIAKLQKYHTNFQEDGFWIEKDEESERVTACPSCAIRLKSHAEDVCDACSRDREVGSFMPKARYLVFSASIDKVTHSASVQIPFGRFGSVLLCENYHEKGNKQSPSDIVYRITGDASEGKAFYRLGAVLPVAMEKIQLETEADEYEDGTVHAGQVLSFTTLAQMAAGDKRIGVLKMDVDNLGQVFSIGLGGEGAGANLGADRLRSVSRLATLSREMTVFFSSRVNGACEEIFQKWREDDANLWPWKDKVRNIFYLVFSGGDDLAVIGPWDRIIELAGEIRQQFKDYTCHNPNLSISAGIYICKPKEPIGFTMNKAEEALGEAKKKGRNRITVMGETMVWAREDEKSRIFQEELAWAYPGSQFEEEEIITEKVYQQGSTKPDEVTTLTFAELREFASELDAALRSGGISRRLPQHFITASHTFFRRKYDDEQDRVVEEANFMVIPYLLYNLERNASETARQKLKARLITTGDTPAYVRQAYFPCKSVLMKSRKS